MTQAPISVWNEVRFTSDGISISLFSESRDGGAILEDEMWFTFDELQEEAPSGPKSLRLSEETRAAIAESQSASETLPEIGDVVKDGNPPSWSDKAELEVVNISDKSADEYVVQDSVLFNPDTVADANPSCDPDEPVVEARYIDETNRPSGQTYAFPLSRLEW